MKQLLIIFISLLVTINCFASTRATISNRLIQQRLNQQVELGYNIGISVAVITSKGTHFYNAGKLSLNAYAKPVTQDTLFQVASVSKVITSLLLAKAIKQGKINLKAPANKYLPKLAQLRQFKNTPITIEDLATHTSGLPSKPDNLVSHNPYNPYAKYTERNLLKYLGKFKPPYKPGSHYQYSNTGYAVLGVILSNVYQQPYARLLRKKITKPLNMNRTVIYMPKQLKNEVATNYGANRKVIPHLETGAIAPAGGVYSTTRDLAKFVTAFMGIHKTKLYLAMQLAIQPITSEGIHSKDGNFSGKSALFIGLGWNIDPEHHAIWKNGNFYGVSSFVGFSQDRKVGVVILANTGNIAYTDNLGLHILDPKQILMPLYKQVAIPESITKRYSGIYQISKNENYEFKARHDILVATRIDHGNRSEPFNLYPMSDSKYFGKVDNIVFTFLKNKLNKVLGFKLDENGIISQAKKIH